jgi:uncharacterized protein YjiS (DUF1127 family)
MLGKTHLTAQLSPMIPQTSTSGVRSLAGRLSHILGRMTDWRLTAGNGSLEDLDDHILADIGLTRADAVRDTMQPFWTAR